MSDEGTSLALRGSARTTFRASLIASANKLSSSVERGSMKWTSKAMTSAPSRARFSVKRAWNERGHLSGLSGRSRFSEDSLSMLTTTTSEGACLAPLLLNSKPRPAFSSMLSAKWKGLITTPTIPVRKPKNIALTRRDLMKPLLVCQPRPKKPQGRSVWQQDGVWSKFGGILALESLRACTGGLRK